MLYTFDCVDCGTKQDIRVPKTMNAGERIKGETCEACLGDNLVRADFQEVTSKAIWNTSKPTK